MKNEGLFDLADSTGANSSEESLISLCRDSFLSLWSLPNTYTSEGKRAGQSSGKEFSDVLVVFGDDIILFSDKDIDFNENIGVDIAWGRWFKKAISKSVSQLYGARNWAYNFPEEIYLDAKCERPLPVKLPPMDSAKFHLVATTRGSTGPCAKAFGSGPGTSILDTSLDLEKNVKTPFRIGLSDRAKPFVHIFDEKTIGLLLRELDTITDFLRYLRAREAFLSSSSLTVVALGEEQLLAVYLSQAGIGAASFIPSYMRKKKVDVLIYDNTHFQEYVLSDAYRNRKVSERSSYAWDRQIDEFVKLGNPQYSGYEGIKNSEVELALRVMASESRFYRRILINQFNEFHDKAKITPGQMSTRMFFAEQRKDIAYIFLLMPCPEAWTREEYRVERAARLRAFCECLPLRAPDVKTVIGIGLDHPVRNYLERSEDLLVIIFNDLSKADFMRLRELADKLGIYREGVKYERSREYEYLPFSSVASKVARNKAKAARRRERKG
ncbi:hypothetical protein P2A57_08300 [Xanthomonas perforans]|uniref:hypothetical protein n=1 Tax=Xanthomonas perforans TaxID=442694 RepID=UPI001F1A3D2A|nr:hypothetical protein [Xanthomonas perforans]MCF5955628.1 hypothetical protein [Xanthomonas perforans]